MTNLIIETDLGHDPDDFFSICWLASIGVKIRAITLVPGEPSQISLAKFLSKELNLNCPVGVHKPNKTEKHPAWGVHQQILDRYGAKTEGPDGLGVDIIEQAHKQYPDAEFFVIGPVSNLGEYLQRHPEIMIPKATMQGGFLAYSQHSFPCRRLDKFENQLWQPTFNLNGNRSAGLRFIEANIAVRRFVPKSLTHTIIYNATIHKFLRPHNRASELFKEGMDLYLSKHPDKKFHDPAAAVCHFRPDIACWVRGKITKIESGWGTVLNEGGDFIAADINYEKFWNLISEFSVDL